MEKGHGRSRRDAETSGRVGEMGVGGTRWHAGCPSLLELQLEFSTGVGLNISKTFTIALGLVEREAETGWRRLT
ncbi:hypothetical protein EON64_20010 [archaeon]|nr:MAG: hypothetical protein EON64_20010 [archaeon]